MCKGDSRSVLDSWDQISASLKNPIVKTYYDKLDKKRFSLLMKRGFDLLFSFLLIIFLCPIMLILSIWIKVDSKGPVFYLQTRVTKNNRDFNIFKFRTMVPNADQLGSQVTVRNDPRVTKVGHFLRKYRLDELPQLMNIFKGDMSFVGTRPEVRRYVDDYTQEMKATLLLPAGVTSLASITYKDEQELLDLSADVDETYLKEILPQKMSYNLRYLANYSFKEDLSILLKTVKEVIFD